MVAIDKEYLRGRLLARENRSHKGDYGHLLLVCGSDAMPGAALLATGAALKSGCGLVTLRSTPRVLDAAASTCPSAILSESPSPVICGLPQELGKYTAIGAGPGLSREAAPVIRELTHKYSRPMVLDADALNIISEHPSFASLPENCILTPHDGELRRLVGDWKDEADKEALIRERLCNRLGAMVVSKGYHTRIFTPSGEVFENTTGNPGMAKGGSGDVLTGLVAGLLARGYSSLDAACLGVWLHGRAGDCCTREFTAEAYSSKEIIDFIWEGFKELYGQ